MAEHKKWRVFEVQNDNTNNNGTWPDGVIERLNWWAEANGKTLDEAKAEFTDYLLGTLGIDDPMSEDEDYLIDSAETFAIQAARATSGAQTVDFVGCFVGVDKKVADKRAGDRTTATQAARQNIGQAISNGIVARAFVQDGVWMLEGKDGVKATEDSAEGEDPWWLVRDGDLNFAMLQTNSEWSSYGKPIRPSMWSRTYYFLGNSEAEYNNDIELWALRVGDPDGPPSFPVIMGAPVRIKVRPPRENQDSDIKWLTAANNFNATMRYVDDFVSEEDRAYLAPERMWPQHSLYADLASLEEVYATQSKMVPGIPNAIGPLVIVKGKVTYVNREGWDDNFGQDPTGKRYPMSISSFNLQREHPDGPRREVSCVMHGHLVQQNHALEYLDTGGMRWLPYANKSTVFIFGRLGTRPIKDDNGNEIDRVPRINALGVYAVPRLVVPAGEGGNTDVAQFGGDSQ